MAKLFWLLFLFGPLLGAEKVSGGEIGATGLSNRLKTNRVGNEQLKSLLHQMNSEPNEPIIFYPRGHVQTKSLWSQMYEQRPSSARPSYLRSPFEAKQRLNGALEAQTKTKSLDGVVLTVRDLQQRRLNSMRVTKLFPDVHPKRARLQDTIVPIAAKETDSQKVAELESMLRQMEPLPLTRSKIQTIVTPPIAENDSKTQPEAEVADTTLDVADASMSMPSIAEIEAISAAEDVAEMAAVAEDPSDFDLEDSGADSIPENKPKEATSANGVQEPEAAVTIVESVTVEPPPPRTTTPAPPTAPPTPPAPPTAPPSPPAPPIAPPPPPVRQPSKLSRGIKEFFKWPPTWWPFGARNEAPPPTPPTEDSTTPLTTPPATPAENSTIPPIPLLFVAVGASGDDKPSPGDPPPLALTTTTTQAPPPTSEAISTEPPTLPPIPLVFVPINAATDESKTATPGSPPMTTTEAPPPTTAVVPIESSTALPQTTVAVPTEPSTIPPIPLVFVLIQEPDSKSASPGNPPTTVEAPTTQAPAPLVNNPLPNPEPLVADPPKQIVIPVQFEPVDSAAAHNSERSEDSEVSGNPAVEEPAINPRFRFIQNSKPVLRTTPLAHSPMESPPRFRHIQIPGPKPLVNTAVTHTVQPAVAPENHLPPSKRKPSTNAESPAPRRPPAAITTFENPRISPKFRVDKSAEDGAAATLHAADTSFKTLKNGARLLSNGVVVPPGFKCPLG